MSKTYKSLYLCYREGCTNPHGYSDRKRHLCEKCREAKLKELADKKNNITRYCWACQRSLKRDNFTHDELKRNRARCNDCIKDDKAMQSKYIYVDGGAKPLGTPINNSGFWDRVNHVWILEPE